MAHIIIMIIMIPLMVILSSASKLAWGESELAVVPGAFARGDWKTVEHLLTATHDAEGLLLRGEARRAQGDLHRASTDHETVWRQLQEQAGPLRTWAARSTAETLLAQHRYADAEQRLNAVSEVSDVHESIRRDITRGRLEAAQGHLPLAQAAYLRAREQARHAKFAGLGVQAQLGIIDLHPILPSLPAMTAIATEIAGIDLAYTQAALLLGLAERALRGAPQTGYLSLAQSLVDQAASKVIPGRQQAEFFAMRAALLETTGRHAAALIPTALAIVEAQRIHASDLMMHEEWRRGRLYSLLRDKDRALAALRRAVFHLRTMRVNIPMDYLSGPSSFQETLSPLYLKLADLLLQQANRVTDDDDVQSLLREARDTLEQLKAAELADYLGDACPLETKPLTNLEAIAPRTGVLYPILLPDRLELLLGIGERQYRTLVTVTAAEVRAVAENFASLLRPSNPLINPKLLANQLFTWIIAPVKPWLEAHQIETLVFIPDGPLRLFPLGALMDGNTFLIERYAIVTEPGLTLIDPQPLARSGLHALVAGMSRPGPVIDEIHTDILKILAGSVNGMNIRSSNNINDALTLPGVQQEVESVAATLNVPTMLNQNFILSNFIEAMKHSWSIVHVASHGFFGGTPENSFFMTYDHLLNMRQFQTLLQGDGINRKAPELLTLSACQTAEGNDRAPLGIIGVAIKSGARSAIGSLWPVSDDATQVLIAEFYRRLRDPQQTKAQAFQQAQITVLRDARFRHPFFWSPFILVGNWL